MGTKNKKPVGKITGVREDGSTIDVDILAPGSAIRFAVGVPGASGTVWRLWSAVNATDVYLAARDHNGGGAKYSFHASGDWRLQYEYSEAQRLGVHRVLEKWDRPAVGPDGVIDVAKILTPADDIVETGKAEPDAAKIHWLQPGPPKSLNAVRIVLIPDLSKFTSPPDEPFAAMQLVDGSVVCVIGTVGVLQDFEAKLFDEIRLEQSMSPPPGAALPYVPRADPAYRCEVHLRDAETDELFIADLLM